MDKKEQKLNDVVRTFYYYKTLVNLKKREDEIRHYDPQVNLGSSGIEDKIDSIDCNIDKCEESYSQAKNGEGFRGYKALPNKVDYQFEWNEKEAEKYKPEEYPYFFFRVLSIAVWQLIAYIFIIIGLILFGDSEQGMIFTTIIAEVIGIATAMVFHKWLKNLYYIHYEKKKYLPILNSRREAYEKDVEEVRKYNKEVKEYNQEIKRQNDIDIKTLPTKINGYEREKEPLTRYLNTVKDAEKNFHDRLIRKNSEILNNFIDNENNFVKNAYHFDVPRRRQFNWGYYEDLYELIKTEQAKEIPDAIRLLEDRYQRAELTNELKIQIQKSGQMLAIEMENLGQNLNDNMTKTIKQQNRVLTEQIQRNTNRLSQVQSTIYRSTNSVISSLNDLDASINGLHADTTSLNVGLNNFQNEVNDGIKTINQTIDKNFENVDRY